jgi:hypothetical protein
MIHSIHLEIERNKQYISQSLLLIQILMITMITLHIVLTQTLQKSWHKQRTPPNLGTEVVVATSHPTIFLTQSGFNFLKNNGTKFLLRESRRDWKMLVAVRHLILQLIVLTLTMLKLTLIWTALLTMLLCMNKHNLIRTNNNDVPTGTTEGNNDLLAYMAGQQSSSGDIHQVLATKQAPDKQKKRQVNEGTSAPRPPHHEW